VAHCFFSRTTITVTHRKEISMIRGDHPGKGDPHRQSMKAFFVEAKRV
jgi:hypothetical protein